MTHKEAIRTKLLSDGTVSGLVGTRVYPQVAKQDTARPYVTLTVISDVPEATHDGLPADLLRAARVQVDCYATTDLAAHQLATAVDNVLGALSGPEISATRESSLDLYEPETDLHRVSSDYLVWR